MPSRGTTAARARAVGMSVAVAALLVACSWGGSPGPTPPTGIGTLPPRPTPTETPTPTEAPAPETIPPERPAAFDNPGIEGAEAVAAYFVELYSYAYATGDLSEWSSLSHAECIFCQSVVDNVTQQIASGHIWRGGAPTLDEVTGEAVSESVVSVRVVANHGEVAVTSADGELVEETPESRASLTVVLLQEDDAWVVRGVEVEETA